MIANLGVFIDLGLVFDVLGSIRISEGAHRLVIVVALEIKHTYKQKNKQNMEEKNVVTGVGPNQAHSEKKTNVYDNTRRAHVPYRTYCRAAVGAHDSFRVASQRVLQQPRELGVAVRNVLRLAVHQSGDDVAEGGKGHVDFGGLLEAVA
jgi:hypothetical protein